MGMQEWRASALKLTPDDTASILKGDEAVGAWQVIAALIVLALRDDAIAERQIDQAIEAAVITLARDSFGEAMEALIPPAPEDAILSE